MRKGRGRCLVSDPLEIGGSFFVSIFDGGKDGRGAGFWGDWSLVTMGDHAACRIVFPILDGRRGSKEGCLCHGDEDEGEKVYGFYVG